MTSNVNHETKGKTMTITDETRVHAGRYAGKRFADCQTIGDAQVKLRNSESGLSAITNQNVYEEGYDDGYAGRTYNDAYEDDKFYAEGFDHGCCDRPSLDELTLDINSERTNPLGY